MSEERMVCRLKDVLEVVKHPIDMRDEEDYMLASIRRRNGGMFDRETKKGKSILTKTLNKVIPCFICPFAQWALLYTTLAVRFP